MLSSFIDCEQDISIVEKDNSKILYPMLVKCYHHLHSLIDNGSAFKWNKVTLKWNTNLSNHSLAS